MTDTACIAVKACGCVVAAAIETGRKPAFLEEAHDRGLRIERGVPLERARPAPCRCLPNRTLDGPLA